MDQIKKFTSNLPLISIQIQPCVRKDIGLKCSLWQSWSRIFVINLDYILQTSSKNNNDKVLWKVGNLAKTSIAFLDHKLLQQRFWAVGL